MKAGVARIGALSPIDEQTAVIRVACERHAAQAKSQGWIVKPYDGPSACFFCERNHRARLAPIKS